MIQVSARLKEKLEQLPELPGIYKMLDFRGDIIYVGKSKNLRKRVRSYFTRNHEWSKIKKLVLLIQDLEIELTDTHLDARLLECQLIKDLKPVFNSQMKNDKEYVYLKIEKDAGPKTLSVASERSDDTYGPFRNEYKLKEIIDSLQCFFPILKKDDSYDFEYSIFPAEMNAETFEENRKNLLEVLTEKKCMDHLVQALENRMSEAASGFRFETASKYRDIYKGLNYVSHVIWRYKEIMSRDILLKIPTGQKCKLFYVSNGAVILKKTYDNPAKLEIDCFILESRTLKSDLSEQRDEKADIDYRDILYSEITSLPKEMVIRL